MLKLLVTIQISWLACLGPMGTAVINPAYVPLGIAFNISTVEASYQLTVYIIFAGVGPLFLAPFANVYGRRPMYLLGNLVAGITNVIAGHCTTWAGIMVTRAINGTSAGCCVAIGAATICDLYYMHERGVYMGYVWFLRMVIIKAFSLFSARLEAVAVKEIPRKLMSKEFRQRALTRQYSIYTFFLTNGPHVAPLIGGYVAQSLGWRWCFSLPVSTSQTCSSCSRPITI
jgi:MFS family permease